MGGLGGAHDHTVFVDPHSIRHVHNAEQLVEHVRLVDQRGMLRFGGLDERASLAGIDVERHGDDLDALRMELSTQFLPHGQVEAASSPRRPRHQQHLLAA